MDTEAQVPAEIAAAISGYEWNLVTASESGARIYLLNKAEILRSI